MNAAARLLWAPRAWIDGRWRDQVLLHIDAQGRFDQVLAEVACPASAQVLPGPVLPSLVNAHSHAFQRAFVGLAERRSAERDDFWGWRDRMYAVALRIGPEMLRAVAAQLYTELLQGGFTQVCEFHYLHHAPDGQPYDDPLAMSRALVAAADDAGIGLTLLPVLYERAGFDQPALRADQRRFATTVPQVLALRDGIRALGAARVNAGVAVHSLRAASPASIEALCRRVEDDDAPLHIHVAEQTGEVDECLRITGCRPMEWLARQVPLDRRWQLVHATHALPSEIEAVARTGAGVVICPGTEANLGDGLCDLPAWLSHQVPCSIGTDSHVVRQWPAELRWLEYGQRLALRQRNVCAAPGEQPATAARLFDAALAASAAPAGLPAWGLVPGARADFLVLDDGDASLRGVPPSHRLDALVFSSPGDAIRDVFVAGEAVVVERRHVAQDAIASRFADAMAGLWQGGLG